MSAEIGGCWGNMKYFDLEVPSIAEIAPQIRRKKISPVELTKIFVDRITRFNPALNAYQTITAEQALTDAKVAEREIMRGRYRGPLHGIPFSIKDNIATKGIKTTAGSKILADWFPDYDATVVERLREAGGILLGKTNMHEWASGSTTINPFFGVTRNPWNEKCVPGGSSGGSAAAVAASMCLASIGTDNAGSVRIPAALCAVVGLKATYGRVSRYGGVAGTGGFSTDHFGPITKTVEDCALILNAIAGYDSNDPLSSQEPVPDYRKSIGAKVKGLKVGILRGYMAAKIAPEVRRVIEDAIRLLESLGVKKQDISIPHLDLALAVRTVTSQVENVSTQEEHLRIRPRDYSASLLYRHIHSLMIPGSTYVTAQKIRRMICEEFERAFERVDLILAPTVPIPAPTIAECAKGHIEISGSKVDLDGPYGSFVVCTAPFNATGLPAISVCCGFSSSSLPIGLQLIGQAFQEGTVFQVAHAYERAAGWYTRKPPMEWASSNSPGA